MAKSKGESVYILDLPDEAPYLTRIGQEADSAEILKHWNAAPLAVDDSGEIPRRHELPDRTCRIRTDNAARCEEKLRVVLNIFRHEGVYAGNTKKVEYFAVSFRSVKRAAAAVGQLPPEDTPRAKIPSVKRPELMRVLDRFAGEDFDVRRIDSQKTIDKLRQVLERGADINAADSDGQTALMIAAKWANAEIVRFLLENGADMNRKCVYGWTAQDYANLRARGVRYGGNARRAFAKKVKKVEAVVNALKQAQ